MAIVRAWRDSEYRDRLICEPQSVLAEDGLEFPADIEIRVVMDTPFATYFVLPREITDGEQLRPVLEPAIPIPAGHEFRLVQCTDQVRYLVLPMKPGDIGPSALADGDDVTEWTKRLPTNFYVTNAVADVTAVGALLLVAVGISAVSAVVIVLS